MLGRVFFAVAAVAMVGLFATSQSDARGHSVKVIFGCKTDRLRLCPQSAPDKAAPCLRKHKSELSPGCLAKLQGG
jgi:hypothetical protein